MLAFAFCTESTQSLQTLLAGAEWTGCFCAIGLRKYPPLCMLPDTQQGVMAFEFAAALCAAAHWQIMAIELQLLSSVQYQDLLPRSLHYACYPVLRPLLRFPALAHLGGTKSLPKSCSQPYGLCMRRWWSQGLLCLLRSTAQRWSNMVCTLHAQGCHTCCCCSACCAWISVLRHCHNQHPCHGSLVITKTGLQSLPAVQLHSALLHDAPGLHGAALKILLLSLAQQTPSHRPSHPPRHCYCSRPLICL